MKNITHEELIKWLSYNIEVLNTMLQKEDSLYLKGNYDFAIHLKRQLEADRFYYGEYKHFQE